MPTSNQAQLLVRFGWSYDEIRNWDTGYAGQVIRQEIERRNKARAAKKALRTNCKHS